MYINIYYLYFCRFCSILLLWRPTLHHMYDDLIGVLYAFFYNKIENAMLLSCIDLKYRENMRKMF